MQTIIGQQKLLTAIESYTARTLPRSLLFVGPSGCGKHTFAKYIAEKFALDFVEVADTASAADLESFMYSTLSTLYLVDLTKFSEKQQNQFLKFIEEPTASVYVILITNSEVGILNTILNRCIKYTFEPYTAEQVEAITNAKVNKRAFEIFKTPGKLLNLTDDSFNAIITLAETVVYNIKSAQYANTLVVSTKINYKDLYNKVEFNLFFDAVAYIAFENYRANGTQQSFIIFNITNKFKQYASKHNFIKEMLMINYLTELWEAVQE